jgi:hypothetical protein
VGLGALQSGDFNEDGKLDLAYAGFTNSGSDAGVVEGDGHGYFYTYFDRPVPGYLQVHLEGVRLRPSSPRGAAAGCDLTERIWGCPQRRRGYAGRSSHTRSPSSMPSIIVPAA